MADQALETIGQRPADLAVFGAAVAAAGGDPVARAAAGRGSPSLIALVGDSLPGGGYAGNSAPVRAIQRSGGRMRGAGNFAVGGTRTDQIINQVPLALATNAGKIIADGSTNDLAQNFPSAATTEGASRTGMLAIFEAIRSAGRAAISLGNFPNTNLGLAQKLARHEVWRQIVCARLGIPHIHAWPSLSDNVGAYKAGLGLDSTHPNSVGADAAADAILAILDNPSRLSQIGALMDDMGFSTTPVLASPVSFGGVGTALPSGYNALGSGASYAVEAPTDGSFGNWLTTTYTAAGSNVGWQGTARSLSSQGLAIGSRVGIGFRIRTQAAGEQTLKPRITLGGSVTVDYGSAAGNGAQMQMYDDWSGASGEDMVVYYEGTITAGTIITFAATATTTGSTTQKVSIQRPIIVPLSSLDLA